jgi:hypothetical protein
MGLDLLVAMTPPIDVDLGQVDGVFAAAGFDELGELERRRA